MLAKLSIPQQFYNWVANQPPEQRYDYPEMTKCACGRFIQESMGIPAYAPGNPAVRIEFLETYGKHFWHGPDARSYEPIFEKPSLNWIAAAFFEPERKKSWTFGQLRERLEKYLPECVV